MLELTEMEKEYTNKFKDFLYSGTTKANIAKVALIALSLAALPGMILVAAAMGNAVQLIGRSKYGRRYNRKQIQDAISGMHRQKIIEYIATKEGKTVVRITKRGESKLRSFAFDLIKINKPTKWDGKWRIVLFDLPVRFKKAREAFRYKLKDLGFIQLQKSVWIYPYPCEDEILFVADFFRVGKYIEILTIDSFLNEEKFKRSFGIVE